LHRSPLQQLNEQLGVQSSSQTPQGHFQFNHHNIGDAGGVPPQTSARLSSGTSTTAACPAWLPIHSAVYSGSLRGTKLLLDAKPECAHALGRDNISPAWFAAQGGYADILRLLIAHRVDLNVPDSKGNRFPIHQAAEGGHTRVVEMLLQNGADPDPVDRLHGITPFWIAAQGGHHEIVEMILSHSNSAGNEVMIEIESTDRGLRPIHQAADGGHLKTVQLLRAKGVDCDPVDARGVTPLWIASQKGHADVVHELLNAGAQVDASPYEESRLPIHEAARAGHLAVVQALLEFGADATPEADTFDDSVPSPFLLACAGGNLELVLLFLHYGVDINATGKGKETAIHFAAFRGHAEVAQLLIGKGCDSDACNDKGWTPLMFAAQGGHLPLVNLLIQNHANVNAEDKDSITALCLASQNGHAGTVRRLVEVGALHLPTKDTGRRPIHQAALHGHLQCVKLLLEHSPGEINMADRDGYNALNLASGADAPAQFSVMRYLLRQGAKVM